MEVFRNVEPVLMLCFCLLCAVCLVYQPVPQAVTSEAAETASPAMHVVVIRAKRLSAAEKSRL